ncbi:MAG: hypothetical protein Q4F06_05310 [Eubacteriales bacterium]|nr:hypothetical protein [Eubacteriales bacterium]
MKKKKRMAWLMSILMIVSLVMCGVNITPIKAAGATISASFKDGSASYGKVEYKVGEQWETYSTGSPSATAVRIVPNQNYEIDWTEIFLRVNGNNILDDYIKTSLLSEDGYTLEADTAYSLENVEFRESSSRNPGSSNYEITFAEFKSVQGNTYTYSVDGEDVTVTVDGATVPSGNKIQIPRGSEGDVTFSLTNFNPDTMEVQVYETNGFNTTLTVTDNATSLLKKNNGNGGLPNNLNFRVVAKGNGNPGGGNQNPPADTGNDDITLNVTGDVSGNLAEIKFNDKRCENGFSNVTVKGYNASHADKTNEIEFAPEFGGARIVSATINGIKYPCNVEGLFKVNVPAADSYSISIEFEASKLVTIIWSYEENPEIEGIKVEHGKVEIVSITRGDEIIYDSTHPYDDVVIDENGGWVSIEKGDDVVLKVIPDYGYQIKSAVINDQTMAPQDAVSTFKLDNIQGNLHFSGVFEKTADTISKNSEKVKDVTIANGGNAATSGSLRMTVADNSTYNKDVQDVVEGSSVTSITSLDLSLENIVSKGDGNYWSSNVTEFNKPISVSLDLDLQELSEGETYSVVRDHEGTLTELDTTYNSSTGTLTFDTNQFSAYTIVKKVENKPENVTDTNANACDGNLTNSVVELTNKVLSEEEQAAVSAGAQAKVWLEVKDNQTTVSDDDKKLVESNKGTTSVGMYFDINLYKQVGSNAATQVKETNGAVTISLKVPDDLLNKDTSKARTYKIVRIHTNTVTGEKEVSIIDCDFDVTTGTITFSTDAFSTYALVYTDNATVDTGDGPDTSDTTGIFLWFIIMMTSATVILFSGRKKHLTKRI